MVGKDLKVAIVHDDFIQEGGAERLVLAMLEIWPHSDLYAVISSGPWRSRVKSFFGKEIRTTWLQKLPFRETLFRFYYLFYPLAIESFNFDRYDLVISSSCPRRHYQAGHTSSILRKQSSSVSLPKRSHSEASFCSSNYPLA